jgi:hypothetical protein
MNLNQGQSSSKKHGAISFKQKNIPDPQHCNARTTSTYFSSHNFQFELMKLGVRNNISLFKVLNEWENITYCIPVPCKSMFLSLTYYNMLNTAVPKNA